MSRVDFYIIDQTGQDPVQRFACRLAEKGYKHGQNVFIFTNSPEDARQLDNLLWTFRDGGFVPHTRDPQLATETPVFVGDNTPPPSLKRQLLINLSDSVPPFYLEFDRVMEVVGQESSARHRSRERYRLYRDAQCGLQTHQIKV